MMIWIVLRYGVPRSSYYICGVNASREGAANYINDQVKLGSTHNEFFIMEQHVKD